MLGYLLGYYGYLPDSSRRIRDWVSRPKANGYQALHLTVMGPDGQWVEIQIRSRRMDDIAEKGFAAHWKYKESNVEEDTELDKWIQTITEILESPDRMRWILGYDQTELIYFRDICFHSERRYKDIAPRGYRLGFRLCASLRYR